VDDERRRDIERTTMGHPLDKHGHKKILKTGKAFIGSSHMFAVEGSKPQQLTVRPKCGEKTSHVCVTHGIAFGSKAELLKHTSDRKDHITAEWCGTESEENRGMDAFGQPILVTSPHGLESDREGNEDWQPEA
jgi:hypothetical protein